MSAERMLPRRAAAGQRGLSIIELMVGIVVSLLVGLAATSSAMVFSASQRQGIGAGGLAVNATTALAALKNDAASAGLGFFGDSRYLCNALDLSVEAALVLDGVPFAPVRITEEATDDRIDIVYATQIESGANVLLNAASNSTSAELMSFLPVAVNQAVLLAPELPGDPCVVRTVTAVTPSTDTTPQQLAFDNTGRHNKVAFSVPPTFAPQARVALLGDLTWHRYRKVGTTILLERPFENDSAVIARNVMALRAQYGISAPAAASTTLEAWQDATGADFAVLGATGLPRVRGLRIGVVTRSPQREKPPQGDTNLCESTTAMPTLFGEAVVADVVDWRCYRYRVSTVVVPLRNFVYGMR